MEKILIETSARHIHLNEKSFKELFGENEELEIKKMLSQPGQFASTSKLDLVGIKNNIKGVSILGPYRTNNQVEVSATDARTLGINVPLRESGDIKGSASIILRNPLNGKEIELKEGLIVAKRHIHMNNDDALKFNLHNGDIVDVHVDSNKGRGIIFQDTVVRVNDNFKLAMHIDTDESNAGLCFGEVYGEIIE